HLGRGGSYAQTRSAPQLRERRHALCLRTPDAVLTSWVLCHSTREICFSAPNTHTHRLVDAQYFGLEQTCGRLLDSGPREARTMCQNRLRVLLPRSNDPVSFSGMRRSVGKKLLQAIFCGVIAKARATPTWERCAVLRRAPQLSDDYPSRGATTVVLNARVDRTGG